LISAWQIRFQHAENQRIMAETQRLTNEAKCYALARDCYKILLKHDKAKPYGAKELRGNVENE